jgi:hypothetical protein
MDPMISQVTLFRGVRRGSAAPGKGRRRAVVSAVFLAAAIAIALVAGPASSPASHLGKVCTVNNQQGKLCLTVSDTPDPVAYSTFDGNQTYLFYHAVLTNESRSSSLSHVGLKETLDPTTTCFRVTATGATCTGASQLVTCSIGAMKKGQSATVDVVVTAPASALTDPPDSTITNTVSASFDERFSDQSGGKQDTATYPETTTVSATAGQTYVPQGQSGKVGTDPTDSQYANATLPSVSADVIGTIELLAPDDFCVDGVARVGNKNYVCRDGGFVELTVLEAASGSHYSNADNPLVIHLRWDSSLVDSHQTVRNFVVFYQASEGATTQIVSATCNAGATNVPCVRNVGFLADGDLVADLVRSSNGRMR